jgi:tetratricopeptide (TPR) repeat protein
MLLSGEYASPAELARFMREAEAIAALQHPNIVQIYDVGEVDGRPYFTMEHVGGGSLTQKQAGVPQPAEYSAFVVESLARAIHVAHIAGIVHRDLKPPNILLSTDGTPKISDFGLARPFEGQNDITRDAARIGTPSYMAPEQIIGKPGTVGPPADIYALGATLYEMLTGRPPFRGETATETERQVLAHEPASPSRLNAKVPRDLETICLKCLRKAPSHRYGTALELAEDLGRFLTGRPIQARPVGPVERAWRWVRRNPAPAAAWLGGLAALGAILGAVLWTLSERAAIKRAVSDDLTEVVRLEEASDWRASRNTLERAKTRLGAAAGRDRLVQRVSQIERELNLVDRLGEMRLDQRASADLDFDRDKCWRQYREAFTEAGLLAQGDTPKAFAARVARSPARTALVDAMDDMCICATNEADVDWLLSATRLADPDPWRDRARDLATLKHPDALAAVALEAPVANQPVPLLLTVGGELLKARPDDALLLLRRVQAAHPSDFWAIFALGEALGARKDPDAIGFDRAAIALRPEAAAAHVNLGLALTAQNRIDEAIDSMSRAVALDPRSSVAQYDLAIWLLQKHRTEEALVHARIAARIDPHQSLAHRVLGRALAQLGKYPEAAESFRRALELAPGDAELQAFLARALKECETVSNGPPATQGHTAGR